MTASSPARLSKCRPGSSTGLPVILADSLPKAITDPENVTAPISTPRYISISWIVCLGGRHADRHRRIDEIGVADEHRGEPDHAVHERDQLGHLRHLDHARKVEPYACADDHRADDVRQAVRS